MEADKPDLVALLDYWGMPTPTLTRGGWQPVKCGFHDDSQASASIHVDWGQYKCHACDTHGDAWALIMLREQCTFVEAVEWAKRANLDMSESNNAQARRPSQRKRRSYKPPGRRGRLA